VAEMSTEFKKNVRLVDSVENGFSCLVLSRAVVDFLESKKLKGLELIPVAIRNHKGKIASEEYTLVNPVQGYEVLDIDRCEPQVMYEDLVISVERFVTKRKVEFPAGVGLFRDKRFTYPIFVQPALAKELEGKGFKGFFFSPTESE